MSKICPINNQKVLYLDCIECDKKICKKSKNKIVIGIDQSYKRTGISIGVNGELYLIKSLDLSVYKTKYVCEFPNLHYYYYCSPDLYNLFEDNCVEPLSQEELAKIANKNWSRFNNFIKNKVNVAFLREMKNRYIKCLVHDHQIIYRPSVKKYVPYSYYDLCISEGYEF